jgi:hypothetical protein
MVSSAQPPSLRLHCPSLTSVTLREGTSTLKKRQRLAPVHFRPEGCLQTSRLLDRQRRKRDLTRIRACLPANQTHAKSDYKLRVVKEGQWS